MYVGDALVAGKCSKSSTATTLLSENESSPEQPNISHYGCATMLYSKPLISH